VPQIYVKAINGGAERQLSTDALGFKSTGPWTRDGSAVLFTALDPKTNQDIWILPVQGDHTPKPYLRTPANEISPSMSPDGRYVSYMSDETGQQEMYVQAYPVPGEKYRVTTGGAVFGGWLPDGRLTYGTAPNNDAYVVTVFPGPPIRTSAPQLLGTLPPGIISGDLSPDLKRMLAVIPAERNTQLSLSVVLSWEQMLRENGSR
jgi:Tol biopolymer transport system component